MALKEWENALADAEENVRRQPGSDLCTSLRTDVLDESEKLEMAVLKLRIQSKD